VMFSGLSVEAFCIQAKQLGFKGIDLWSPFDKCKHLQEAKELGAVRFRKLLDRHDLTVGAWTTYSSKDRPEGFPGFADFIGACGGGVVVRGSTYVDPPDHKLEDAMRRFFDELQPEIELARKHKVRLAIENHAYAILNRAKSFEVFTRLNPAPEVVGIAVAPYHLQRCKADVAEVIRTCGNQLLFFYAWQSEEGKKQLPGHGPVDFAPWLKALAEIEFDHWMTPFMHGDLTAEEMAPAVAKAVHYLKNQTTP
jgi:sugar phosphate isomerase/epimerase